VRDAFERAYRRARLIRRESHGAACGPPTTLEVHAELCRDPLARALESDVSKITLRTVRDLAELLGLVLSDWP
jgi:hypothetical protein